MVSTARTFTSLILILSLLATGHSLASARGQAMAVGQMVICIGSGPVTVHVDAQGHPVGPPHVCPDCALSLIASAAHGDTGTARPMDRVRAAVPNAFEIAHSLAPLTLRRARAPPLTV
jgi:hypothetical protein